MRVSFTRFDTMTLNQEKVDCFIQVGASHHLKWERMEQEIQTWTGDPSKVKWASLVYLVNFRYP